jgi:hypothetical protein
MPPGRDSSVKGRATFGFERFASLSRGHTHRGNSASLIFCVEAGLPPCSRGVRPRAPSARLGVVGICCPSDDSFHPPARSRPQRSSAPLRRRAAAAAQPRALDGEDGSENRG